ncbi:hypothetical protein [Methylorubrum thiocyanatum]|uniref:hypothetical protein n=1 Tax=Methylorubrum thiocyanatum TaxID=47958 RepID=UPI0035C85063
MRVLRLVVLAFGMLGGLAGLNATANAAPIPIAPIAGSSADAPLLAQVHWYGRRYYRRAYSRPRPAYRRVYWRPRPYYRRVYWRPRPYYRRAYWRPRPYYRRAYWGPSHYYRRPYWRARYDHRPHFYRPWS